MSMWTGFIGEIREYAIFFSSNRDEIKSLLINSTWLNMSSRLIIVYWTDRLYLFAGVTVMKLKLMWNNFIRRKLKSHATKIFLSFSIRFIFSSISSEFHFQLSNFLKVINFCVYLSPFELDEKPCKLFILQLLIIKRDLLLIYLIFFSHLSVVHSSIDVNSCMR